MINLCDGKRLRYGSNSFFEVCTLRVLRDLVSIMTTILCDDWSESIALYKPDEVEMLFLVQLNGLDQFNMKRSRQTLVVFWRRQRFPPTLNLKWPILSPVNGFPFSPSPGFPICPEKQSSICLSRSSLSLASNVASVGFRRGPAWSRSNIKCGATESMHPIVVSSILPRYSIKNPVA